MAQRSARGTMPEGLIMTSECCVHRHPSIADAQAQPGAVWELRDVPAGPISSDFVLVVIPALFQTFAV